MKNNICQCGAVKSNRSKSRTRAPRALVCLQCWRRVPIRMRRTFLSSHRNTKERLAIMREILEWLKAL